ncbi:DUF2834 domain-containing protein [Pseudochrobactrum algeriensis]|uniref:DUF2834 domain-containing protein n=1 Tax=Pseudochrobactrum algeriensis TaxID=2834768 RepID=UPI001BCE24BA|nr:DUF2834 domain-containing protein [Pseudochrobactrum algeriensis]MBX8811728.1 DUF2834 domain-containing protein [Ochrobactrum sp. MR34]QVQ35836.1 DUF2834 domain-containing protein [Pseudochrobactrum algeriensis]QVQ39052.1 DUF2834 domain-containing protein [Pseudochrobactrum algeriensis]QVQ42971.1 DUF2834 domain-containing protein [Pseudochrobactrum algeriensis]
MVSRTVAVPHAIASCFTPEAAFYSPRVLIFKSEGRMRQIYFLLMIIGAVFPLYFFCLFLIENRFNSALFFEHLFANNISRFFAADVAISALVLIIFIIHQSRKLKMPSGYYALIGLAAGVSFALPLFLYLREGHIEKMSIRAEL